MCMYSASCSRLCFDTTTAITAIKKTSASSDQEVGGGRGDWMELAQDRDRWRALVGTVRDFRVP